MHPCPSPPPSIAPTIHATHTTLVFLLFPYFLCLPTPSISHPSTFLAIGSLLFPYQANSHPPLHQHNMCGSPKFTNQCITSRRLQPIRLVPLKFPHCLGDICVVLRTASYVFLLLLSLFCYSPHHTSSLNFFFTNHSTCLMDNTFIVMTPRGLSLAALTR